MSPKMVDQMTAARHAEMLKDAQPDKPVIRSKQLVREPGFLGRRAGETKAFRNKRVKSRVRNKLARKSRKR